MFEVLDLWKGMLKFLLQQLVTFYFWWIFLSFFKIEQFLPIGRCMDLISLSIQTLYIHFLWIHLRFLRIIQLAATGLIFFFQRNGKVISTINLYIDRLIVLLFPPLPSPSFHALILLRNFHHVSIIFSKFICAWSVHHKILRIPYFVFFLGSFERRY